MSERVHFHSPTGDMLRFLVFPARAGGGGGKEGGGARTTVGLSGHKVNLLGLADNMASSAGYNSEDVVVCAAVRTPIGSFNGCLSSLKAHELGTAVIKEVLSRGKVAASDVSEVILGQVINAGRAKWFVQSVWKRDISMSLIAVSSLFM